MKELTILWQRNFLNALAKKTRQKKSEKKNRKNVYIEMKVTQVDSPTRRSGTLCAGIWFLKSII